MVGVAVPWCTYVGARARGTEGHADRAEKGKAFCVFYFLG
jgi:hypothetical protein